MSTPPLLLFFLTTVVILNLFISIAVVGEKARVVDLRLPYSISYPLPFILFTSLPLLLLILSFTLHCIVLGVESLLLPQNATHKLPHYCNFVILFVLNVIIELDDSDRGGGGCQPHSCHCCCIKNYSNKDPAKILSISLLHVVGVSSVAIVIFDQSKYPLRLLLIPLYETTSFQLTPSMPPTCLL